jgi:hypothetical protein
MNTIRFKKLEKFWEEWISDDHFEKIPYISTEIFINDTNLIDLLKIYELLFAQQSGHPEIAGLYTGIDPGDPTYIYRKLKDFSQTSSISFFQCGECMSGLCPFNLGFKIRKENNCVYWFDFQQVKSNYPYRVPSRIPAYNTSSKRDPHNDVMNVKKDWDYSNFGPFQFSEIDYEVALKEVRTK